MAEQIPYAVVTSLINRLGSAAFREFGRIRGVMDELERLKNTIESIRVVLNDADEKQQQNRVVQHWIRRLKDEVLHPTDDMLDEFVLEDMRHKPDEDSKNKLKEVLHSFTPKIAFRLKMAHKIEKIQKKINDVVKDMAGLNLTPHVVVINQTDSVRRETGSFVLESDIVGREDNKNEIISLLRQPHGNTNVSLIAIVGIGGLGKTALAQLVYNDVEVQNLFEKRMWVCVSDNFDVKTIVKKILESLVNGTIDDKLSLDNLQNKLRENLTGRRYLLVLDDLWNESHQKWRELRTYLMCGAQDSKVLVTTRSKTVAQTMGISTLYVLNGLNIEESWNLLKNIAFRDDTEEDVTIQTLEPIGKKIAEKCRGVPLAIRTLGGLLMNTRENSEWSDVLLGEFWQLCEDEDSIMPVLRLSYQNLSPQMKQCFAYCSLYPKDWKIKKDELIRMWMAQGYLEYSGEKQSMEDVGNQFVNIFLMKSFFQDVRMTNRGDLDRFKMHDLMHDLAMQVAGSDCCYMDSEQKKLVGRPMHVRLKGKAIGLLDSLDASRVRTLILHPDDEDFPDINLSNFKKLRVLISWNCFLSKLSSSKTEINHLRYLKLCRCKIVGSFSKFIDNLAFLQTLILNRGLGGHELSSKTFSKLINLRSVEINNCRSWEGLNKKTIAGFEKYSMGRCSLTNIVEISLGRCHGLQYLPPLEHLPFLKSLTLFYCKSLEYIYFKEPLFPGTFFPSLESLMFRECNSLSEWVEITRDDVNDDTNPSQSPLFSFPRLSQLEVSGCSRLACMPAFPNLDMSLELDSACVGILEATLKNLRISVDVSDHLSLPPLSKLKSLHITRGLKDVNNISEDWLQNLISLEHLTFDAWYSIFFFLEIEIWFKDSLNCLPSLQKITFHRCNLTTLPYWVCNLSSLKHIVVKQCYGLASLPEGMSRLTNLMTLEVINCPLLFEECQRETSATQSRIAHIPNIILK